MTKEKITLEYAKEHLKKEFGYENPPENSVENTYNAMKKSPENFWWESTDIAIKGFYQLFEEILLINGDSFEKGLGKLLDRPFDLYAEWGMCDREKLKKEAIEAMQFYLLGERRSDEYRDRKMQENIKMIEDYCRKTGKSIIPFDSDTSLN